MGRRRFPRAHAAGLAALVALGPLLRLRARPHSVFASPRNRLEARLINSAGGWTSLFLASLLVASLPLLRPPPAFLLRLVGRWLVGVAVWNSAPRLLSLVEGALGRCVQPMAAGLLLLPHGSPAPCRASGAQWEGPLFSRQAFSLVYCALGLAEEAGLMGLALYGDWPAGKGRGREGRGLEEARWEGPPSGRGQWEEAGRGWSQWRGRGLAWGQGEGPRSAPRDPGVLGRSHGFWGDPGIREGPRSTPMDPGVWEGPRSAPMDPGVLGRSHGFWGDPGVREEPRSAPMDPGVWEGPRSAPMDPGVRSPGDPGVLGWFWGRDPGVREGPRSTPMDPNVRSFEDPGALGWLWERDPGVREGPRRPGWALNVLFLLNVTLLVGWQALLGVTLMYRHDWPSNAVGGAAGWAAWLVTYGGWFRWAWPGPTR